MQNAERRQRDRLLLFILHSAFCILSFSMPTVSVIMAVYNAGGYLAEAVDSVLAQTFRNFEFVIIDDGSTDGSGQLLREYAAKDSRIRVIQRENKGQTPSLNEGIELARCDLIARMDADDACLPNRLERQVAFMNEHPQVVLLGGAYAMIDARGRLLTMIDPPRDNATLQEHALSGRTPICHPLAMMRREAVRKVGGYDPQFQVAQDLDLWLKLGEIGEIACIPELLVKYRQHDQSLSETKQQLQLAEMRLACERAYVRRGVRRQFLGDDNWRATSDRASKHRFTLRYGWWAFNSAQRRTALVYGMKAIRTWPLSGDSWRLLLCAAMKPLPSTPKRTI
jgi:glycosyltransferase involved in cell wall biosynthesis